MDVQSPSIVLYTPTPLFKGGDENVRGGCGVLKSALLRFFLLSCSIIIRLSCWPRSTTWGILSILSQGRGQRKARFAPEDH